MDRTERNHRFLEEALELVQAIGCTQSEAHQLVDYVFSRPKGEPSQELGGVLVTLNALATAFPMPVDYCGEKELTRVWGKIDKIRAKQATKPKHSPLPESGAHIAPAAQEVIEALAEALKSARGELIVLGRTLDEIDSGQRSSPDSLLDPDTIDAIDAALARAESYRKQENPNAQ